MKFLPLRELLSGQAKIFCAPPNFELGRREDFLPPLPSFLHSPQKFAVSHTDLFGAPLARSLLMLRSQDESLTWGSNVNDEEVAQAILGYLAESPQAMDTVEGIAQWWIMRQQVRVTTTTVTRVLRELSGRGLLEEFGEGKQRWYRLKR